MSKALGIDGRKINGDLIPGATGLWGRKEEGGWFLLDATSGDDAKEFLDDMLYHARPGWEQLGYREFQVLDEDPNLVWTREDNIGSFKQGWGVFETGDGLNIQKLDDPSSALDLEEDQEPAFEFDEDALDHVLRNAATDPICRKAIRLVYGF